MPCQHLMIRGRGDRSASGLLHGQPRLASTQVAIPARPGVPPV